MGNNALNTRPKYAQRNDAFVYRVLHQALKICTPLYCIA